MTDTALAEARPAADPKPAPEKVSRDIGKIVHYRLTDSDAQMVNLRRDHARINRSGHRDLANGTIIHVGNHVAIGDTLPMMIVKVHGEGDASAVNGQVFLDGNDTLWVQSVGQGDGPGTYTRV